jgi:hypothetical protein
VVLYGCDTWSLTLWEEHRLRVFENRVLRRIYGPKRNKTVGGWGKLNNEKLHNFSTIRMIMRRRMRWVGHAACMRKGGRNGSRRKVTTRKTWT